MSPVARRTNPGHTGRSVVLATLAVVAALGLAFFVANLASQGDVDVRLGDDRFNAGSARDVLDDIIERDAPLGFNDVANFRRPIWLDNTRNDPVEGWRALGAYLPDDPDCLVQWNAARDVYVAECDDDLTFPRSGEGLRSFPVVVDDDGRIQIDLQDQTETTG